MTSQDPELPRVGLMSLPKDILQHIVVVVGAQDEAIRQSGIPLASASSTTRAGASTKLPGGKWAFAFGHGLGSLSLVNKALRALSLPLLVQTVKATQLEKPLFEFRKIEPALLAGITSLDLREADADSFAAAALALDALPSLYRIEMQSGLTRSITAGDCDEHGTYLPVNAARRELAVAAFEANAPKITHMAFEQLRGYDSSRGLASIAKFAACSTLRHLDITALEQVLGTQDTSSLSTFFAKLDSLEVLSIKGAAQYFSITSAPWQSTHLAALGRSPCMRQTSRCVILERVEYVECLAAFSPRSDEGVSESSSDTSTPRFLALIDTMEWAEKRVQQLYAEGDVEGVQEMAEAFKKVAERKMLERL
ncbi:hypothetical protein JCM9279_000977 [Rhodotorula babjevae]